MIPKNGTKTQSFSRKKRKKKFNKVFILLVVLVYIVSRTTPILTENSNDYHTITHGALEDSLSFEGNVLRDEIVLTHSSQDILVESGERVANEQWITEDLRSPSPGIITHNRDGLEAQFNYYEILRNPENNLDALQNLITKEKIEVFDGIRLVRGYYWGVVGKIPMEEAKEIQSGQNIQITAEEQRVHGEIVWIQEVEDTPSAVIMVRSKEYLEGIYENRKIGIALIKREVEGLLVPLDAIYYKDGNPYVTKRKFDKNMEVPVQIVLADEQKAILTSDEFTDSKGNTLHTVSLYDEVLLNHGNNQGKEEPNE